MRLVIKASYALRYGGQDSNLQFKCPPASTPLFTIEGVAAAMRSRNIITIALAGTNRVWHWGCVYQFRYHHI